MAAKLRYVEVTDGDRFRGVVLTEPMSVKDAELEARKDAAHAWRTRLDDIQVFVTRTLTPDKHKQLLRQVADGTLDPDWWVSG